MMRTLTGLAAALSLAASASGCVSSRMSDTEIDRLFISGQFEAAAERLKTGYQKDGEEEGKDSLLYLLDLGLALHYAGKEEEAIKAFRHADTVAEIKDYTSIAAEAGTLFTSENIKSYQAEDFENVLISVYLAICYAVTGQAEDAIVEARRVNRKLQLYVQEAGRKYTQNAFARYLSAALYESEREWDDARLDYEKTRELVPDFPPLEADIRRTEARRVESEIIVIFENGISPEKVPHPAWYSIPKFRARYNPVREAVVEIDGQTKGRTSPLFNVEKIAMQNLDEKYGAILAKKIAGVVVKESVAAGVSAATKEPLFGALLRLAFYASDQADVRSWKLLPRDFQIFRTSVEPGTHMVQIRPVGGHAPASRTVQVAPGRKVFLALRYMPQWD